MDDVLPTFERTQHNTIEERVGRSGKRKRIVVDGTSLDYYLRNSVINKNQYHAGVRLYTLWRVAGIEGSITMKWDMLPSSTSYDGTDRSAIARRDVYLLAQEMGQDMFRVVENVCCYDMMATEWAEKEGRKKRSAIDILRFCLDGLDNAFSQSGSPRKRKARQSQGQ